MAQPSPRPSHAPTEHTNEPPSQGDATDLFDRVRFALVRPRGALNIGLAARAIKNMGFRRLDLVAPPYYHETAARRSCSRADDVLDRLRIFDDLPSALEGAALVAATTSRRGRERGPFVSPAELGSTFLNTPPPGDLVVLLGPEDHGLANQDLGYCPVRVTIPVAPEYPSLNLAQAVQIIAYELRLAALAAARPGQGEERSALAVVPEDSTRALADRAEIEGMYTQLWDVLERTEFLNPQNPEHIQRSLRRIYDRARMDEREVRILRGVLSGVQRLLGQTE